MQDSELEAMDDIRADGQAHNSGMGDRCFQLWGFGQIASPSVSRGSHRAVHSLGALGVYLGQRRWKHSPGEPSAVSSMDAGSFVHRHSKGPQQGLALSICLINATNWIFNYR